MSVLGKEHLKLQNFRFWQIPCIDILCISFLRATVWSFEWVRQFVLPLLDDRIPAVNPKSQSNQCTLHTGHLVPVGSGIWDRNNFEVYVGISSALCMIRLSLSYGTGEDAATQTLPTETFAKLGIATWGYRFGHITNSVRGVISWYFMILQNYLETDRSRICSLRSLLSDSLGHGLWYLGHLQSAYSLTPYNFGLDSFWYRAILFLLLLFSWAQFSLLHLSAITDFCPFVLALHDSLGKQRLSVSVGLHEHVCMSFSLFSHIKNGIS